MPEGKNRSRVLLRDRQAFVSLGPLIQLGSSQLPTNARENRIWPVSRPLEAVAAASRVRGGHGWRKAASSCLDAFRTIASEEMSRLRFGYDATSLGSERENA
jgi:hypothetical protein